MRTNEPLLSLLPLLPLVALAAQPSDVAATIIATERAALDLSDKLDPEGFLKATGWWGSEPVYLDLRAS